ncbi:MAG: excinuclease ABC subunit UvrA [Ignavibacteria bacterium]|nr:excinuclease ABC subunit UvrA [Ignavibacteria bacterium]
MKKTSEKQNKSKAKTVETLKNISIKGARENNLQNISIDIPRDKFVVITGISGSGKSSLAFDTIYAEGQRRYVECLSTYARQFLGMMKKPDIDSIEGLSPAISIEQKSISHNPRSTVGTTTEIYDYIRLLFAKIGVQHCVKCNIPVEQKSLDQIIENIFKLYSGKKIQILSPLIKGRKGHYQDLFTQLMKLGFTKIRLDGEIKILTAGMQASRYQTHDIDLVIDRCDVEEKQERRIVESVELALAKSNGTMLIVCENGKGADEEKLYSVNYSCPSCQRSYESLSPNMFSYNSQYGACPACLGLGEKKDFHPDLIVPDKSKTISSGGIDLVGKKREVWLWTQIEAYAKKLNIDIDAPISEIPADLFNKLMYGDSDQDIDIVYTFSNLDKRVYTHKFAGIIPALKHHYESTSSSYIKKKYEDYMSSTACSVCNGGRLKIENLFVKIADSSISEITKKDIVNCQKFFQELEPKLTQRQTLIGSLIIKEIITRLEFLKLVGLSYLTLDRSVRTLSGGESQRIRLASQIGSELVGVLYVLDEPSIGLHQHDNNKLIDALKKLRDLGNSIIVVEHDKQMIESSDYLVDMGPGAGQHGGYIVFSELTKEIYNTENGNFDNSLTAQYLTEKLSIDVPKERRNSNGKKITLFGAKGNNLKNLDLEIPLGLFICITGMSGSGKSSIINDTLYPIISSKFYNSKQRPLEYSKISGLENIDKVINIDQSPIGRTPRSNPATYTGLFTLIRDFFTMLPESKVRGYKPGRFSFNIPGGRCEECEGAGIKKIEMNFLPEVYVKCDVCYGKRYNRETLDITYKDKSIADVLDMTVEEALRFFNEIPNIKRKIEALYNVGLTYIKLGQQAPTLSGGEAQRVKLATELSKRSTGKTIYLLDEPTTGLHFEDIRILMKLLNQLVDKGNTLLVIEHNLDVIKCADWVIDLGPEGGDAGGYIVAEGTPESIAKVKNSYTGQYLQKELKIID